MSPDYRAGSHRWRESKLDKLPVEGPVPPGFAALCFVTAWEPERQGQAAPLVRQVPMPYRFGFYKGKVSYANRDLRSPQYRHLEEKGGCRLRRTRTGPCRSIVKRLTRAFSLSKASPQREPQRPQARQPLRCPHLSSSTPRRSRPSASRGTKSSARCLSKPYTH